MTLHTAGGGIFLKKMQEARYTLQDTGCFVFFKRSGYIVNNNTTKMWDIRGERCVIKIYW